MALRSLAVRFAPSRRLPSRAYSSSGKVLSEEERAAENLYIKKMEKERLEKAKQAGKHEESGHAGSSTESGSSIPGPTKDSSTNLAVFAGVAGLLAVGWFFIRPSSKKEEEKN